MTEDEWLRGFLEFCRLPRQKQEEHIRRTLEKKRAEWQEDPEPGRVLRADVRERLLQQQRDLEAGDQGEALEDFVPIDIQPSEYTVRILKTASRQLMELDPALAWEILHQIQGLRKKEKHCFEPLKGGMLGIFRRNVGEYRVLYQPYRRDLLLIHNVSRSDELFESASPTSG